MLSNKSKVVILYALIIAALAFAGHKHRPTEHGALIGLVVGIIVCAILYKWKGKDYIAKDTTTSSGKMMKKM